MLTAMIEARHGIHQYGGRRLLPIHDAASEERVRAVEIFLQIAPTLATSVTSDGQSAFHYAAVSGNVAILRALHARSPLGLTRIDDRNASPLHYASCFGHTAAVNWMIAVAPSAVAFILVQDADGQTCAHWAAITGHAAILRVLIRECPEVNHHTLNHAGESILDCTDHCRDRSQQELCRRVILGDDVADEC